MPKSFWIKYEGNYYATCIILNTGDFFMQSFYSYWVRLTPWNDNNIIWSKLIKTLKICPSPRMIYDELELIQV